MPKFSFAGKKCTLKCPKCRGQNLQVDEVWNGNGIHFTITDGVMPDEADDHFQGGPVALHCGCRDCKHNWTPRKARTINDIYEDDED